MSQHSERQYYLLREIGGKKIRAGRSARVFRDRLYFDWNNAIYSVELSVLRENNASLDQARKESLQAGKILGLMSSDASILAVIKGEDKAELMSLKNEKWEKTDKADITSTLASCANGDELFFMENNPKSISRLYQWSADKGKRIAAIFEEPMKIYSLIIKNGKLRFVASRSPSLLFEIDLANIGDKTLNIENFKISELPFLAFKELDFPSLTPLFSIDGDSIVAREDGSKVWDDTTPGKSGKQIAASAILDNRLGVLGSWRRDAARPAACLYLFDGEQLIYKRALNSDKPERLRWSGYETNQSGLSGRELFIPCYGGEFIHIRRVCHPDDRIGTTILAEGKDYTILGNLKDDFLAPYRQLMDEENFNHNDDVSKSVISKKIEFYHMLGKDIEKELGYGKLDPAGIPVPLEPSYVQSQIYMIHAILVLWREFMKYPHGTRFSILDVGPGTGGGSELLALLHSREYSGYYADVDVIDISDSFRDYFKFKNPDISTFYHQDIFNFDKKYDFIICSHCIEHVEEPYKFVLRLQKLARKKVIITAPWKENPKFLTKGHINIFDEGFISLFPDKIFFTEPCVAWGMMMNPRYEQFCLALDGKADDN